MGVKREERSIRRHCERIERRKETKKRIEVYEKRKDGGEGGDE